MYAIRSYYVIDASSTEFYSISGMRSVELNVDKIVNLVQNPLNNHIVAEPEMEYGTPKTLSFDFSELQRSDYSLNLKEYFVPYVQDSETEGGIQLKKISYNFV